MVDMATTGIARRILAYHMDHRLFPAGEPGRRKAHSRRIAICEPKRRFQEFRGFLHVLCQDREVAQQVDGHDVCLRACTVKLLYRALSISLNRAETCPLKPTLRWSEFPKNGRGFDEA